MTIDKTRTLIALVWFIIGGLCGIFIGKGMYDRPIEESVTRDTVRITDTIPHYYPQPVDGTVVRYITRVLPVVQPVGKGDTLVRDGISQYSDGTSRRDDVSRVDHFLDVTKKVEHCADTSKMIAVEIPIESKHYHGKEYDAWVSGYEPSLDSIKVYRETQYITEKITKVVKDNKHFFLDVSGGCDYVPNTKTAVPFAELGMKFKTGKFGIGAYGGYSHDTKENKAAPYVGAKVSYDIISF